MEAPPPPPRAAPPPPPLPAPAEAEGRAGGLLQVTAARPEERDGPRSRDRAALRALAAGSTGRGPARPASAEPRESPRGLRGPAWAAGGGGGVQRPGPASRLEGGPECSGCGRRYLLVAAWGAEGSALLAAPAGTGVAGLLAAGWRRGRRGGGPGLERAGEGPRQHLRPCGCGCLSPAGGPGPGPRGRYPAAGRELGAQDALPVWGALPSPAAVSEAGRGVPPSPRRSSLTGARGVGRRLWVSLPDFLGKVVLWRRVGYPACGGRWNVLSAPRWEWN